MLGESEIHWRKIDVPSCIFIRGVFAWPDRIDVTVPATARWAEALLNVVQEDIAQIIGSQ
jgi:hypothetical protein